MIVNDNSAEAFRSLETQMDEFLDELGKEGKTLIRDETPVRTGKLRDGNEWELTGDGEGRWFNEVEYALPVETGYTRKLTHARPVEGGKEGETTDELHIPANAFMQRGLDRLTQRADEIAREHFSGA